MAPEKAFPTVLEDGSARSVPDTSRTTEAALLISSR
jgi:hypothetical protein